MFSVSPSAFLHDDTVILLLKASGDLIRCDGLTRDAWAGTSQGNNEHTLIVRVEVSLQAVPNKKGQDMRLERT